MTGTATFVPAGRRRIAGIVTELGVAGP